MAGQKDTLCWECNNRRCSWRDDFTPVNGWDADFIRRIDYESYTVHECPEFIGGPIRCNEYVDSGVEDLRSALALSTCKDFIKTRQDLAKAKKKNNSELAELERKQKLIVDVQKMLAETPEDDPDYNTVLECRDKLAERIRNLKLSTGYAEMTISKLEYELESITKFIMSADTFCGIPSKDIMAALRYGQPNFKLRRI